MQTAAVPNLWSRFEGICKLDFSSSEDVRDINAFFVGILSSLKAVKRSFERSYDKQNITLVVITYEIAYEMTTRVISFM